MARIHEYQGKQVLQDIGIPVPRGRVASSNEEARKIAEEIGKPVAIKAQIGTTGRHKSGGILFADSPEEAAASAAQLLGSTIKGLPVNQVLVEEKVDVEREFYLSVIVSPSYRIKAPVMVFSTEGGVDVEEVAARNPEKVANLSVDYLQGVGPVEANKLLSMVELDRSLSNQITKVVCGLYEAFKKYDARIAEINPLVLTKGGAIVAADCRITIDDNSVFRHPEFGIRVPRDMDREATDLEMLAWSIEEGDYRGTGYFSQMVPEIKGEGYVGFHGIGGGGAMLGASALITKGVRIANYADTSGDPPASKVYKVIKAIFSQPIDGYILMGACLANQEQWHHGHAIVKALKEELEDRPGFPVMLVIAGNKEKETHEIIRNGMKALPARWELYGRDHIYKTDFIADRFKELLDSYLKEKRTKAGGEI